MYTRRLANFEIYAKVKEDTIEIIDQHTFERTRYVTLQA
jgi:hypothetical protein